APCRHCVALRRSDAGPGKDCPKAAALASLFALGAVAWQRARRRRTRRNSRGGEEGGFSSFEGEGLQLLLAEGLGPCVSHSFNQRRAAEAE
ncbi:unnamed protein product, partial [Polarella glacialis]